MKAEDRENVVQRVGQEGFDYTFMHYSRYEDIKDKRFHELREQYISASEALKKYLRIKE